MKFAMMRPAVSEVLGQMFSKPQTGGDWLRLGMRVLPEAGFAAYNAAVLPQGASWGDRLAAGGEALAINALGSYGGELGGGLIGRAIGRRRGLGAGSQALAELVDHGLQAGGVLGGTAIGFAPMPLTEGIYQKLLKKQEEEQLALDNVEQGKMYSDLAGFGALSVQPLLDPRLLM